jgi:7,8-dihydropterin-6-yl-methyl-4-(beta-D-ribofuranosyl)aminobenzene 5'-phosphate synthase
MSHHCFNGIPKCDPGNSKTRRCGSIVRLTVLVDNNAGHALDGEWGLSFFIEADDKNILFDLGASDLFLRNAARLKIDLMRLDYLILSHGHYDHTWGLDYLFRLYLTAQLPREKRPSLIAHPGALVPKFRDDGNEFGMTQSRTVLERNFTTVLTKEPFRLAENLIFLGEIPRKFGFEAQKPLGRTRAGDTLTPDRLWDDTALAYKTPQGLIIITGCSHSGICNIIEYAREVCGDQRVFDVVGGFHLKDRQRTDPQLMETAHYLEQLALDQIHPCHCTDLQTKIALAETVNVREVYSGLTLEFD